MREKLYRGPVKSAVHHLGVSEEIHSFYWLLLKRNIESPYPVSIDGATATFGTPTYPAYRMAMDAEGEENAVVRRILHSVLDNDTFYDIGANIGTYTCLVADKLSSNGEVVAIEPYPPNIGELFANIWRNEVDATVIPRALGDVSGTFKLDIVNTTGPGAQEHSLVPEYRNERVVDSISVPVATGNTVIEERGLPLPDVAKIDVEGAAPDVIRGMGALTNAHTVFVEPHDNESEIRRLLSDRGFSVEQINNSCEERDYLVAKSA